MAVRITDITGAQTDHVLLREIQRPVFVIKPNGRVLGAGLVSADLECVRTGQITHSIVRLANTGKGEAIPSAWLFDAIHFIPKLRSVWHVA